MGTAAFGYPSPEGRLFVTVLLPMKAIPSYSICPSSQLEFPLGGKDGRSRGRTAEGGCLHKILDP